jgi:hypothetical protein
MPPLVPKVCTNEVGRAVSVTQSQGFTVARRSTRSLLGVYSAAGNRYYSNTPYQDEPEPGGQGAAPALHVRPAC